MTEIRPGEFKGPAFKKGHLVCDEDLCRLQKIGKNHLYVVDELEPDQIHEDEAAALLAGALAGEGVVWKNDPHEGKIELRAEFDGLLTVDTATLAAFNMIDEVMAATLHQNTLVKKGEMVAATRAIPMIMDRPPVDRAAALARAKGGVLRVHKLIQAKVGLVITGSEVYTGLIEDRFEPVLRRKVKELGSTVHDVAFAPDDADRIAAAIRSHRDSGCDIILVTGGMSVDPDDVTRKGIYMAGAEEMHYGSAVLPGAMFLIGDLDGATLMGIPACGLHHRITVLDLVLPRILAGQKVGKAELAFLGHGGLCRGCEECIYPKCSFGVC